MFPSAHNFFEPQPIKNADVFFLRFISHDWPTPSMKIVLKQLRASAQPTTTLILMDNIVPYAASTAGKFSDILGPPTALPPKPLLPNFGIASGLVGTTDLQASPPSNKAHHGVF